MKQHRFLSIIVCLILFSSLTFAQLDTSLFSGMRARSIGPAGMSGRIASIDAVVSDPNIIYVGAATGGVWKSTNGGLTWRAIFDKQPTAAIGAVAIFQANPSVVWVGTGEGNPRNSAGVGNGIYKSLDAGETWTHMGLKLSERIHRIIIDPRDHNVVYAGVLGPMWSDGTERGVYKTTDGGKTWKRILYSNEKSGCADLVMDPGNPNKLFAALWEYRRSPWFFKSGGQGSGLYVTYDGGDSWKQAGDKDGLPSGELGRIGVAFAKNNPDIVYALVEAKKNALLRSNDGGRSWRTVNDTVNVNPRPFYYGDLRVDPQNENRIYSLHSNITMSENGGRSFINMTPGNRVHSDHHALWIHPENGKFLIDGNDGGVAISYDRGRTWRFVDNLPLAQFYHINVDMEIPYNVYGGMQDNGSWRGPSDLWENGGIRNFHWNEVGFGDGFATMVDRSNPNYGYAMSQGGNLFRFNVTTGERKDIRPSGPDNTRLRFNWSAGINFDPFDTKTIYYGSQFVHRSTDRGDSWTIISPDLTTNDPAKQKADESGGLTYDVTAAENHCTILTIAPSALQQGVLWVGTDDGNVQITQDGGKTWKNVVGGAPDLAKNAWCAHIEPSKYEAGTAYVVFDDHRRGNFRTYVYKVENFGSTWTSLTKNDPTAGSEHQWGYAHVVEQDPVKKDLLYLGTEFGLWVSFNEGRNWQKWTHGVPTVGVYALIVHPREHDLVIGTHGRAAFILDDIRPFRSVTKEILDKPIHVFEIPPTYQHTVKQMDGYHFPGDAFFRGENKAYGAMITYTVNKSKLASGSGQERKDVSEGQEKMPPSDTVKINVEISGASGVVIRKMNTSTTKNGVNRFTWNLRRDGFRQPRTQPGVPEEFLPQGPEAIPGKYTVKLKMGKEEVSQTVEVLFDPRVSFTADARRQKLEMLLKVGQRIEVVTEVYQRIERANRSVEVVMNHVRDRKDDAANELRRIGTDLKKSLSRVSDLFIEPQGRQGIFRSDDQAVARLNNVLRSLNSTFDAPTDAQSTNFRQAEAALESALKEFNSVFTRDVAAFKQKVQAANVSIVPEGEALDVNWKRKQE